MGEEATIGAEAMAGELTRSIEQKSIGRCMMHTNRVENKRTQKTAHAMIAMTSTEGDSRIRTDPVKLGTLCG